MPELADSFIRLPFPSLEQYPDIKFSANIILVGMSSVAELFTGLVSDNPRLLRHIPDDGIDNAYQLFYGNAKLIA
jgi:hypothetical protein